jgi:hypothetical protein
MIYEETSACDKEKGGDGTKTEGSKEEEDEDEEKRHTDAHNSVPILSSTREPALQRHR